MLAETMTCPFCNAQFPAEDGPRVVCPRCQEVLPGRDGAPASRVALAPELAARPRRSNRSVLTALLLVMIGMASLALVFAVWTTWERRRRDNLPPTKVVVTAPAGLSSLGYLPPNCDIVLGLHVGELLEHPLGRDLLTRFRLPVGNIGFDSLQQWTGVPLEEIDHAVLGVVTQTGAFPYFTLVVQTRRPVHTRKLVEAIQAGSAQTQGNKKYYPVRMLNGLLTSGLWVTEDEMRVVLTSHLALDLVPDVRHADQEHLLPSIRKFLDARTPGTQFWAVGHIKDWEMTLLPTALTLGQVSKETGDLVKQFRGLEGWFQLEQDLTVNARIEGQDASAATTVATLLTVLWKGGRLFGGRGESQPLVQELSANLRLERKDNAVTLETKAQGAALRNAFASSPPDPEKK